MGAALDEEGVAAPADHLEADEEVRDQLDPVVLNPLESGVFANRPLVAGPLRPERDKGDFWLSDWH
jgi:hypothetical protein